MQVLLANRTRPAILCGAGGKLSHECTLILTEGDSAKVGALRSRRLCFAVLCSALRFRLWRWPG